MENIKSIVSSIEQACIKISEAISYNNPLNMSNIVSTNESNDDVKSLDILSNDLMIKYLSQNENVKVCASEENAYLIETDNTEGKYLVTFDPLDGSSNIDSNITIGTIFGIFIEEDIKNKTLGESIVASGYCLYGGSTQLVWTSKFSEDKGVDFYILNKDIVEDNRIEYSPITGNIITPDSPTKLVKQKKYFKKITNLCIPNKGKVYSINESNKSIWLNNDKYHKLVNKFIENKYTQRWVGSLVADAHRTLIKGGYFSYPADTRQNGRLRLIYEAIPFCFIIEQAGGKAYLNDNLTDWKDTTFPEDIHLKTPLTLTSVEETALLNNIFS